MLQRHRRELFIDRRCISYNEDAPSNVNHFKVWKNLSKDNHDIDHSQMTLVGGRNNEVSTSVRSRPTSSGGPNSSVFYISRSNSNNASNAYNNTQNIEVVSTTLKKLLICINST